MNTTHLLTIAILGAGVGLSTPPASAQLKVQLISRDVFFGNPDRTNPLISPDGTKISYLAPVNGVMNVWVGPIDDPDAARPVTHDMRRGIRVYFWAYTNKHLLYLQDPSGGENWVVHAINLSTAKTKALTPTSATRPGARRSHKVTARIQRVSHKFPYEILVGLNDRDPARHDIYRLSIATGERTLVQRNDGFLGFLTDDEYDVRLAARLTPDGGSELLMPTPNGNWHQFAKIPMQDMFTTSPIDFNESGTVLYMVDSRGRNTAALTSLNLETGESKILAKDYRADITDDLLLHLTKKFPQAVSSTYTRKKWHFLDPVLEDDFSMLREIADGELSVNSRTLDDSRWIVSFELDNGPVRYYHFDRTQKKIRFLFASRSALDGLPLATMHPIVIKSRDGLNLVSYYTLPVGADSDFDGRPDQPLPMVLNVHGGPWWRDAWGYDSWHQWLANRGYAVLSVNFRGSTGFGKNFINAANREWGGRMHDDLIDAVQWAIDEGIADADRVAIMGGSYGGYAALVGMTFTPDVFACGTAVVGPSNLVSFLQTIPPAWDPNAQMWATRVGDHRTADGRSFLQQRSPLNFVDQIKRPMMIVHGANDPSVNQGESDRIVSAMQQNDVPVTYLIYPDEGHGIARPANRMAFFAVAEAFLAEHLGGRYEPIGDDLDRSRLMIPVGAGEIPSVQTAIAPD